MADPAIIAEQRQARATVMAELRARVMPDGIDDLDDKFTSGEIRTRDYMRSHMQWLTDLAGNASRALGQMAIDGWDARAELLNARGADRSPTPPQPAEPRSESHMSDRPTSENSTPTDPAPA